MTRNEAAEAARRAREQQPEDWADYPRPTTTVEVIGYVVGGAAALLMLALSIYAAFAADAAHEYVEPEPMDWAPFCRDHECDLMLQEPPVNIWDGVDV